jgi:DNA-binding GntR family transcriptional regulator
VTMTRLQEPSLVTDQVFSAIHGAIMSGRLAAGARLRIRDLADQLGTSPMPVRDAIIRLEQAGLAQRVAHKGAVVTNLTPAELVHVYDTRVLLEREATRLGSQQLTAAEGAKMRVEQQKMMTAVRAGRGAEALDHDEALLTILYTAARNPVLLELIRSLWQRCRPYKLIGVQPALETADAGIWSFHDRLIQAATAHDWKAAMAVTDESLRSAITRIRVQLT